MTGVEVAALITAIFGGVSGLIIAIAALMNARNSAARMDALEKDNGRYIDEIKRLSDENDKKSFHNDMQDKVILDQNHKISQWMAWGQRIGRRMNQMELQIGAYQQQPQSNDDTQPIKMPKDKDWITGRLGPIDVKDILGDDLK